MTTGICYNPDGSVIKSPIFQPCDQFNNVYSMCCGTNHTNDGIVRDICEPNGLCLGELLVNGAYAGPSYTRQGCTDQTWQSPNCLRNVCTNPSTGGSANGNSPMTLCSDKTWCCGQGNTTCCNNNQGISLASTLEAAATATAIITTISINTPTTTSIITTTITASAAPSNSLSRAGIALVTVGAVLLIAAIIAFFFLYCKIGQKRRRGKDTSQQSPVELDDSLQKSEMPVNSGNGPAHELITYRAEVVELQSQT